MGAKEKVGAVLVVGGGIAGIQASLDLAEMGFRVHLVEGNPAIGGRMAQLDKVFPTNDCSMCIVSPKLNDLGGHANIETLTDAGLVGLSGGPGDFRARVLQRPRFLDGAKCNACGDCAKACPALIPNEFNQGLDRRPAVAKSYAQAHPYSYSITKGPVSPCVAACPAQVNAHAYVSLAARGRFQEALGVILESLPLPGSLGRVCPSPCEAACRRGLLEGPLGIRGIKRLVADRGSLERAGAGLSREAPRGRRVAIVGSGPAGLSAAFHLARLGLESEILEAEGVPGGALRLCVPDFRLPPGVLEEEIAFILSYSGAGLRLNAALGRDFSLDSLFREGFGAVFLAMGAHGAVPLGVPGGDLEGVVPGLAFLKAAKLGGRPDMGGKRVLVLGGGNVAVDAARTAVRLGARVELAYRRGRAAMPALPFEVGEAEAEGVAFLFGLAPLGFERAGGRVLARLARARPLGDPNNRGTRLSLDPKAGRREAYDLVIAATGQAPSTGALLSEPGVALDGRGRVVADPGTFATGRPGVFAGGDALLGPARAIDAVAAGKGAALSISRFLLGEPLGPGRPAPAPGAGADYLPLPKGRHWGNGRAARPAAERARDFREADPGLSEAAAMDEAGRCAACGACCRCGLCVGACLTGAISRESQGRGPVERELAVGAVILAPGLAPHDPSGTLSLRYADSPNIVTSLEFERILSSSGPTQGGLLRPSDGRAPKAIAWVQCVGSRDRNNCDARHCSSVCCMSAMKEAALAAERSGGPGGLRAAVFYMDLRSHGKDFERYHDRARGLGVSFLRSRVHTLTPLPDGGVAVSFVGADGRPGEEAFDMAVLSVGLAPPGSLGPLAGRLGVALCEGGFLRTLPFDPVGAVAAPGGPRPPAGGPAPLPREGVLACGAATEPKDIPTAVVEASAAAAAAAEVLRAAGLGRALPREYPDERDVEGEAPRIGVFICHCGINIASVVDVEAVAAHARTLPFVEHCGTRLFACSADTQEGIKEAIAKAGLNRVVVASCSPRTHERMFRETLAQAGLNKYLFEMANIRDQDSWVHKDDPARATLKAMDLVRGAVAKAAFLEPAHLTRMDLTREALVVGGGCAGMASALSLARQGFRAHLLEAGERLGGRALGTFTYDRDLRSFALSLAREVAEEPLVEVHLGARPVRSEGFVGNFRTAVLGPGGEFTIRHGVTILATGGVPHEPAGLYGRGVLEGVITQPELDALLLGRDPALERPGAAFAFIQCAGSRVPERPWCSKVCCTHSLDQANAILDRNPGARVFVMYRDMRSYGLRERKYEEARRRGVVFVRYEPEGPPEVSRGGGAGIRVRVRDHVLGRPLDIGCDFLTLASGVDPAPTGGGVAEVFKAQLNPEGFLLEAHLKLRPVDLATEGQFMAGLAHYPKPLEESLAQARAAAARAAGILSKPHVMVGGVVAKCDPGKCAACCTCVRACPLGVPRIAPNKKDPSLRGHAYMEPAICQGCGICVGECPGKAIKLQFFSDEQLLAKVGALSEAPGRAGAPDRALARAQARIQAEGRAEGQG